MELVIRIPLQGPVPDQAPDLARRILEEDPIPSAARSPYLDSVLEVVFEALSVVEIVADDLGTTTYALEEGDR